MANRVKAPLAIEGRPGTDPETGPDADSVTPPPRGKAPARPRPEPRRPAASPPGGKELPAAFRAAADAARRHAARLRALPGVVNVRAGFLFRNGMITSEPCIVAAWDPRRPAPEVPAELDGIPVQRSPADPLDLLAADAGAEAAALVRRPARTLVEEAQADVSEAELLEAVPAITYTPPAGANLAEVTGPMVVTCHVSPDCGWTVLDRFLGGTERKIRLGMYDFTAPHIYESIRRLLKQSSVTWHQTLDAKVSLPKDDDVDSTKGDDKTETAVIAGLRRAAGPRFQSVFASTGKDRTFASAYHIKVAVRDDAATWLSSGNWQSSNQPNLDFRPRDTRPEIARYNREWHLVIGNAELAGKFQQYLEHDFATAREAAEAEEFAEAGPEGPDLLVPLDAFEEASAELDCFEPEDFFFTNGRTLTVQPILTPDNYIEVVRDLLREKPQERLYFQNQSLNPVLKPTPEFEELMSLLAEYSRDPRLDVRIIFRNIGPVRKKLESLQLAGFNMQRVRMQAGCHTKGIIVDGHTVVLGSHNWTNQGLQANRDASVLIRHTGIAGYYEKVFRHDWHHLARPAIREELAPVPVTGDEAAAADAVRYVRVPWADYIGA